MSLQEAIWSRESSDPRGAGNDARRFRGHPLRCALCFPLFAGADVVALSRSPMQSHF